MFLLASKLLWILAEPVNLLILGMLVGAFATRSHPVGGRRLALTSAVLLFLAEVAPIGQLLLQPLEQRFPSPPADMPAPYGIIVLGGAIDDALSSARGQVVIGDAGSRVTETAVLARRYPNARIVYTGGDPQPLGGGANKPEAYFGKDLLVALGVDPDRITVEPRSRNTDENARFSAAMLKPTPDQTWLLVTSAFHMPRAMGLFRKAGFKVVAYPTDYRTFGDARDWVANIVRLSELNAFDLGVHEWTGLFAYRAAGKIDEIFPGP